MTLNINSIDRSGLTPSEYALPGGERLLLFPDDNIEITKADFIFEAGTSYQQKLLQADATSQLLGICTPRRSVQQIAEMIDGRGAVVDRDMDLLGSTISVYCLPKYAGEIFSLLHEMLTEATFPQHEFDIYCSKRRQQLQGNLQRTGYVARNLFYRALYGEQHPFGRYATPDDVDKLSLQDVAEFYRSSYSLQGAKLQLSGYIDDRLLEYYCRSFGGRKMQEGQAGMERQGRVFGWDDLAPSPRPTVRERRRIDGAVQSTIRIGRLLPWRWDDTRYTDFMVLNTLLGGYFGSRLMSNIREDKGYTYGIYSQTDVLRGSTIFYVTADVNGGATDLAVEEIYKELSHLCDEPVSDEELALVKNYMAGDFMRSIDGIFERSDRWRMQQQAGATSLFDQHYCDSVASASPRCLQQLAQQVFRADELTEIVVGAVTEQSK